MKNTFSKGFTLVELLIVITILAALAAAVVVVLNPAELLAQARDAQRLSDMTTMRDAVNLYISQTAAPLLCGGTVANPGICVPAGNCTFLGTNSPFGAPPGAACPSPIALPALRAVTNTGWIPINFAGMPGGSPIAVLPIDPVNNATFFYAYRADTPTRTFRLVTRLESIRHRTMMAHDGGPRACATGAEATCFFEVGTNMGTAL